MVFYSRSITKRVTRQFYQFVTLQVGNELIRKCTFVILMSDQIITFVFGEGKELQSDACVSDRNGKTGAQLAVSLVLHELVTSIEEMDCQCEAYRREKIVPLSIDSFY